MANYPGNISGESASLPEVGRAALAPIRVQHANGTWNGYFPPTENDAGYVKALLNAIGNCGSGAVIHAVARTYNLGATTYNLAAGVTVNAPGATFTGGTATGATLSAAIPSGISDSDRDTLDLLVGIQSDAEDVDAAASFVDSLGDTTAEEVAAAAAIVPTTLGTVQAGKAATANANGEVNVPYSGRLTVGIGGDVWPVNVNRHRLRGWDRAVGIKKGTGSGKCKVLWIGDSWSINSGSLVPLIKTQLQATLGNGGHGYVPLNTVNSPAPAGVTVTKGGEWLDASSCYSCNGMICTSFVGADATLTITGNCSSFKIHYGDYKYGGNFTWQLDGGSESSPISMATTDSGNTQKTWKLSQPAGLQGLEYGEHTLVLKTKTASRGHNFAGVELGGETASGAVIDNISVSGFSAISWQPSLTGVNSWLSVVQDTATADVALHNANFAAWLGQIAPNLIVIMLGINDSTYSDSYTITRFKEMLGLLASRCAAVNLNAPVLLLCPSDASAGHWGMSAATLKMRELAGEYGYGFVDNYALMGPYVVGGYSGQQRGLYENGAHVNASGASIIGLNVLEYLLPRF